MDQIELNIRIEVRQTQTGVYIQLSEQVQLKPAGFTEMCKILGQFQDLTDRIKKEREA